MNPKIVLAKAEDKDEILNLYKMQLGREFCPWDEHYPEAKEIDFDLSRDALFVMKEDTEAGEKIIAAISIDDDPNVESMECWSEDRKPGAELARLAVHPDWQNQGLARQMLAFGMEKIKEKGYKSVHFLVNRLNTKALRSYAVFGFETVGECSLYDQPFICYEKAL